MVDQILLDKLKTITAHPESAAYDSYLLVFNIFKQLAEENDELKKMIQDLDICIQFVVLEENEEIYKYWISIRDEKVEFGEGNGPNVTSTLKTSREIFGNLLIREADVTSAYKAGDLSIEGNVQDIIKFGEVLLVVGKLIFKLIE